ncbi:glycosyl-hydrolase family 105/88 [Diplonema papillatum]|nr:glycosyl-hydrolase family 105/88 [Diplonema papillatum]
MLRQVCFYAALALVAALSPAEYTGLAGQTCVEYFEKVPDFAGWNYNGGTIQMGLWEMLDYIPASAASVIAPAITGKLNAYKTTPPGSLILNNQSINFGKSIGDSVAQFPAAYNKMLIAQGGDQDDVHMVTYMADRIKDFPFHLPTGLVSRQETWPAVGENDTKARGVWGDDGFMGTAVLLASNQTQHIMEAWKQLTLLRNVLNDPTDGLFRHGALENNTNFQSCCKWGRANGWVVMAMADTLVAMQAHNLTGGSEYAQLQYYFTTHMNALTLFLDPETGLLHNVLNMTQTPLETSATGMTLYGLATAMLNGIMPRSPGYVMLAERMFTGVASMINADGTVSGVIGGTGIKDAWQDYGTPGSYNNSGAGLGGIFRGMAAYLKLNVTQ